VKCNVTCNIIHIHVFIYCTVLVSLHYSVNGLLYIPRAGVIINFVANYFGMTAGTSGDWKGPDSRGGCLVWRLVCNAWLCCVGCGVSVSVP